MRVVKTEILNSDTGEVVSEKISYGINNGSGWCIQHRKASEELALKCDSAITFRVYHLLVSMQENYGVSGVVCTKKFIQDRLGVSRKSVYTALEWLSDHDFLVEAQSGGCTEFFFNPSKLTIGRDKDSRVKHYKDLRKQARIRRQCKEFGIPYPLPKNIALETLISAMEIYTDSTPEQVLKMLVACDGKPPVDVSDMVEIVDVPIDTSTE